MGLWCIGRVVGWFCEMDHSQACLYTKTLYLDVVSPWCPWLPPEVVGDMKDELERVRTLNSNDPMPPMDSLLLLTWLKNQWNARLFRKRTLRRNWYITPRLRNLVWTCLSETTNLPLPLLDITKEWEERLGPSYGYLVLAYLVLRQKELCAQKVSIPSNFTISTDPSEQKLALLLKIVSNRCGPYHEIDKFTATATYEKRLENNREIPVAQPYKNVLPSMKGFFERVIENKKFLIKRKSNRQLWLIKQEHFNNAPPALLSSLYQSIHLIQSPELSTLPSTYLVKNNTTQAILRGPYKRELYAFLEINLNTLKKLLFPELPSFDLMDKKKLTIDLEITHPEEECWFTLIEDEIFDPNAPYPLDETTLTISQKIDIVLQLMWRMWLGIPLNGWENFRLTTSQKVICVDYSSGLWRIQLDKPYPLCNQLWTICSEVIRHTQSPLNGTIKLWSLIILNNEPLMHSFLHSYKELREQVSKKSMSMDLLMQRLHLVMPCLRMSILPKLLIDKNQQLKKNII